MSYEAWIVHSAINALILRIYLVVSPYLNTSRGKRGIQSGSDLSRKYNDIVDYVIRESEKRTVNSPQGT